MVCRDFILPEICKPCLFLFLRNLFYLKTRDRLKVSELLAKTYGAFLDRVEVDAEVKTRELMAEMTEEELRALAQLDGEW